MMSSVFLLCTLSLACFLTVCSTLGLPVYIKPCKRDDPEFSKCAIEHGNEIIGRITEGDPMYGIPVLDPLRVGEVQTHPFSKVNVTTTEMVLYGLKNMKIMDFTRSNLMINVTLFGEQLRMTCKYSISGQLGEHTIQGSGETEMKFYDTSMPYYLKLGKTDRKEYVSVTDVKIKIKPKKVTFKVLSFQGDQERVKLIEKSSNEKWQEMMKIVSPIVEKMLTTTIRKTADSFFNNIPLKLIFI